MVKNFIPILTFFLIALVTFFAFQIIDLYNKEAIPEATQKQILTVNPNLDTKVIDQLKASQKP